MKKKKHKNKSVWIDLLILSILPLIAVVTCLTFQLPFFFSTIFFFCIPALYLSFRTKKAVLRTLIFSLPFSLVAILFIDHLAALDKSWFVPTIFPFKIFNTIPLEDIFLGFSFVYFICIFYGHFLDKGDHALVGRRMKYFSFAGISFSALFILLIFTKNQFLHIHYWYLIEGIVLMLSPAIIFLFSFLDTLENF